MVQDFAKTLKNYESYLFTSHETGIRELRRALDYKLLYSAFSVEQQEKLRQLDSRTALGQSCKDELFSLLAAYRLLDVAKSLDHDPSSFALPPPNPRSNRLTSLMIPKGKKYEKLHNLPALLKATRTQLSKSIKRIPTINLFTEPSNNIPLLHVKSLAKTDIQRNLLAVLDNFQVASLHLSYMANIHRTVITGNPVLPDVPNDLHMLLATSPSSSSDSILDESEMAFFQNFLQETAPAQCRLPLHLALAISPLYLLIPSKIRTMTWNRPSLLDVSIALGNDKPTELRSLEAIVWTALFDISLARKEAHEAILSLVDSTPWKVMENRDGSDPIAKYFQPRSLGQSHLTPDSSPTFSRLLQNVDHQRLELNFFAMDQAQSRSGSGLSELGQSQATPDPNPAFQSAAQIIDDRARQGLEPNVVFAVDQAQSCSGSGPISDLGPRHATQDPAIQSTTDSMDSRLPQNTEATELALDQAQSSSDDHAHYDKDFAAQDVDVDISPQLNPASCRDPDVGLPDLGLMKDTAANERADNYNISIASEVASCKVSGNEMNVDETNGLRHSHEHSMGEDRFDDARMHVDLDEGANSAPVGLQATFATLNQANDDVHMSSPCVTLGSSLSSLSSPAESDTEGEDPETKGGKPKEGEKGKKSPVKPKDEKGKKPLVKPKDKKRKNKRGMAKSEGSGTFRGRDAKPKGPNNKNLPMDDPAKQNHSTSSHDHKSTIEEDNVFRGEPHSMDRTKYWEPIDVDVFAEVEITLDIQEETKILHSAIFPTYDAKGEPTPTRIKAHNDSTLNQILSFMEKIESDYISGKPLHATYPELSAIHTVSQAEYVLLSDEAVQDILRTRHIVITDIPIPHREFKTALKTLSPMSAVIDVQDLSKSNPNAEDQNVRVRQGTVQQLLESAEKENGKVLNALHFPMPFAAVEPSAFSSDAHALLATIGQAGWKQGMHFPVGDFRFGLAATSGAFHTWHLDCNGLATFVLVIHGAKLWIIARPRGKPDADSLRRDSSIRRFLNDFDIESPNGDWILEAILLRPGTKLLMRPNTLHAVFTPKNTVCHGGHFLAMSTIQDSFFGIIHDFICNKFISNTTHVASRLLLHQMLSFSYSSLVDENIANDEPELAHVPKLDDFNSFLDLATLCIWAILANVLDFETYTPLGQGEDAPATENQLRRLEQYDYNSVPLLDRDRATYSRGIAIKLIEWLNANYEIFCASSEPSHSPSSTFEVNAGDMVIRYLKHICGMLLRYKAIAICKEIEGAPNCSLTRLIWQLEHIFPESSLYRKFVLGSLWRFRINELVAIESEEMIPGDISDALNKLETLFPNGLPLNYVEDDIDFSYDKNNDHDEMAFRWCKDNAQSCNIRRRKDVTPASGIKFSKAVDMELGMSLADALYHKGLDTNWGERLIKQEYGVDDYDMQQPLKKRKRGKI